MPLGHLSIKPTEAPAKAPGPRRPEAAQLIVMSGDDLGVAYPLVAEGELTLGRSSSAGLTLSNERVSRLHARLRWAGSHWVIEDMESLNGTYVNEAPIDQTILKYGDRLRLGEDLELLFARDDGIRDELLQRQRFEAVGRLTLGIAHDFNNMLAAMSATLDYLDPIPLESLEPPEYEACLRDMQVAVHRASQLAARILRSGRSATGRPERMDLSELTREVVQLARRSFPRSVDIRSRIEPRGHVLGDAIALHQVLMNLLVNARDAMPEGGDLEVTLRRRSTADPRIVIEVTDSGVGMDEETREQIFAPHFSTKSEGSGLGLAAARAVVGRHGGRIEVESELGEGSTFRIALPAVESRPSSRESTTRDDRRGGAKTKLRLLLADDEIVLRRSLRRILVSAGFRVEEVGDGAAAVDRVCGQDGAIDLAILDVDMPELDGVEACRKIVECSPTTPIVILTGHDEAALRASLREAGALAVLSKPVSAERLVTTINTAYELGRRRARGLTTLVTVA